MLLAVFRLQAGLERRHRRAYNSLVLQVVPCWYSVHKE